MRPCVEASPSVSATPRRSSATRSASGCRRRARRRRGRRRWCTPPASGRPAQHPGGGAGAPLQSASDRRRGRRSSSTSNPASSRIGTPSCSALSALEPACSPTTTKSVFFETDDAALPPRDEDRLLGLVAAELLQRPGDDDGQALERARRRTRRARPPARPRPRAHLSHDRVVPVDGEPLDHRLGDRRADALGARPAVASSAVRIASIEPNSVASARAAVGPTCRIESATSTRHSGTCLALSRLASSRWPLATEHAARLPRPSWARG